MSVLRSNYPQIEAHYSGIDLLSLTLRKGLNLVEAWLLTVVSSDAWDNDFKPILTTTFDDQDQLKDLRERWQEPGEDGLGEFKLVRAEDPAEETVINFKPAQS